MKTKTLPIFLFAAALLGAAGCSSVSSRISSNRATYDTWPVAVQEKVAAGQVDVGFTPEQVKVALGEPDRVATRTTVDGQSEAWIYRDHAPRIGFGFGVGSVGANSAMGVGVHTGDWPLRPDESKRVVFEGGTVTSIDSAQKK